MHNPFPQLTSTQSTWKQKQSKQVNPFPRNQLNLKMEISIRQKKKKKLKLHKITYARPNGSCPRVCFLLNVTMLVCISEVYWHLHISREKVWGSGALPRSLRSNLLTRNQMSINDLRKYKQALFTFKRKHSLQQRTSGRA